MQLLTATKKVLASFKVKYRNNHHHHHVKQPFPRWTWESFSLYLFRKSTSGDKWQSSVGWRPFLSSNQQCQNTDKSSGLASLFHHLPLNPRRNGYCSLYTSAPMPAPKSFWIEVNINARRESTNIKIQNTIPINNSTVQNDVCPE